MQCNHELSETVETLCCKKIIAIAKCHRLYGQAAVQPMVFENIFA